MDGSLEVNAYIPVAEKRYKLGPISLFQADGVMKLGIASVAINDVLNLAFPTWAQCCVNGLIGISPKLRS
jgi:hypothetical protein